MTIGLSDGTSHESELDLLLSSDRMAAIEHFRNPANDNKNLDLGPGIDLDAAWKVLQDKMRPKPTLVPKPDKETELIPPKPANDNTPGPSLPPDPYGGALLLQKYGPKGPKTAGLMDWFFPKSDINPEEPLAQPLPKFVEGQGPSYKEHFPTEEDAAFAQKNENAYGSTTEPYVMNKVARVLGARYGKDNRFLMPLKIFELGKNELKDVGLTQEDVGTSKQAHVLNPIEPPSHFDIDTINKVHNVFARASLAVARDPLAALGFDPANTLLDVKTISNLAGLTSSEPGVSRMYANRSDNDIAATVVHESIHNGIKKLQEGNPEKFNTLVSTLEEDLKKDRFLPSSKNGFDYQEHSTRQIMRTVMGNPEYDKIFGTMTKEERKKFKLPSESITDTSQRFFEGSAGKHYSKFLKGMQDLAAETIAQKRPGGPR